MRAWLRRRWLALAVTGIFMGLLGNVWYQDGTKPFVILLVTAAGCVAVLAGVAGTSGYSAASHAKKAAEEIRQLESARRKELTQ